MAEKKEHKIVSASSGENVAAGSLKPNMVHAKPVGNAAGLRAGAIILWVVALAFEVLALMVVLGKINLKFMPSLWQIIIFLVLDLACVIIGSQLWKKANHIKPASEKNKTLFWIWNNLGVIVAVFAFLPLIIIMLSNKNLDKKTKVICVVAAVIALLIGGAASIDYNPVSQEQQEAAMSTLGATDVYWTPYGHVYHTHVDEDADDYCPYLNQSDSLTRGTVEQAIAANRTRLCSWCARHDAIEGVATDDVDPNVGE